MSEPIIRLNAALEGRYRIEHQLGEGGMATVYLADDLRHERKVALKVLKPELAAVVGAERFLAEIKTTAQLQHPNILPLHDSGEADSFLFYVMPYVEGESLRERLDRDVELPVDEAVRIAADVAEALHAAHEQGVIHRDVKPANILLSRGRPLVADFGIALAISTAGGGRLTETGLSMGTPYYMSPEQASADRDPTAASDVYSLACVLYEMLVGSPPFEGGSAQAVLAKILTSDVPSAAARRKTVPPNVEAAILGALEKLPADRPPSAKRFAEMLTGTAETPIGSRHGARGSTGRPALVERLTWAAAVGAIGFAALVRGGGEPDAAERQAVSVDLALPDSIQVAFIGAAPLALGRRAFAMSDDGAEIVLVGERNGTPRLFLRRLDSYELTEIPGTEGAYDPFFSPSGAWVGFFVGNELRRVRTDGGQPIPVAEVPNAAGADWGPNGMIVAAASEGSELLLVAEEGGVVEDLTHVGRGHGFPQFLPDGRVLLSQFYDPAWILDLDDGEAHETGVVGEQVMYAPPGFLVATQGATLYATRFDLGRTEAMSAAVPVVTGVRNEMTGAAHWYLSEGGSLLYAPGSELRSGPLVWVDAMGAREEIPLQARVRENFALSPDGGALAVAEIAAGRWHIWVYDLDTGRPQRVTAEGREYPPLSWSPDGAEVLYNGTRPVGLEPPRPPRAQRVVPGGEARAVSPDFDTRTIAHSWSASGLVGVQLEEGGLVLVDSESGDVTEVPTEDAFAWGVIASPQGDAVSYTSGQTGEYHVFLQQLPPTGEAYQVSVAGGAEEPLWSQDGRRLYFRSGRRIMVAEVSTRPTISVGTPEVFYEGNSVNLAFRSYDVSPDGSRILIMESGPETASSLRLVQDWLAYVEQRTSESSATVGRTSE